MRKRYDALPSYKYTDVEGASPVLEKSAGKPLRDYKVYGKSYQKNYDGKNILNINSTPIVVRNVEYSINDSSLTVKPTAASLPRLVYEIKVKKNTNYYVSGNFEMVNHEDFIGNSQLVIRTGSGSGDYIKSFGLYTTGGASPTKTIGSYFNSGDYETLYVWFYFSAVSNSSTNYGTSYAVYSNFQIQEGTVGTEYEPYIPVPTPDCPQNIEHVGVYDETTGKYKISLVVTCENKFLREYHILLDEPLRQIGKRADYIDFKNQKIVRNIGYKIYTENDINYFDKNGDKTPEWFIQTTNVLENCVSSTESNNALCNYFENKVIYSNTTESGFQIRLKKPTFRFPSEISLDVFRTFLQNKNKEGNPLTVYYIYEVPVEENITLPVIETFLNTNKVELNTKIQPSNIKIQYYKKG